MTGFGVWLANSCQTKPETDMSNLWWRVLVKKAVTVNIIKCKKEKGGWHSTFFFKYVSRFYKQENGELLVSDKTFQINWQQFLIYYKSLKLHLPGFIINQKTCLYYPSERKKDYQI